MNKKVQISIEIFALLAILCIKYLSKEYPDWGVLSNPILNSIIGYIVFWISVNFTSRAIIYFYYRKNKLLKREKNNIHFGVENIATLLLGLGLIVTLFGMFGVDVKSLLTSLSIVAAALAIISKEFINDFLAGIYFSFSQDFEINDYVKLENQKGKVLEISMLKIKLLNDDDDVVIIPNGKIYINEIVNYTKRDIRLMSVDFQIDIKLIQDIEVLEKELVGSISDFSEFIESNSYLLKIVEVKKDYLDLKFQYTIKNLDRDLQRKIRKNTVRKVFNSVTSKN